MADILYYELNGYEHKDVVNTLQAELTQAFSRHQHFPIKRILELLPIHVSAPGRILARDQIVWKTDGLVANEYETSQVLEFSDPALGTFYLSVPAKIESKYAIDNTKSQFQFQLTGNEVQVQLNKLVEQGYNRSAFQIVKELHFESERFITILVDRSNSKKITHLIVILSSAGRTGSVSSLYSDFIFASAAITNTETTSSIKHISLLDENCCPLDDEGDKWYVFYRKGTGDPGICVEHKGTTIEGGSVAWEQVGGPFNSEQEARNFSNTCPKCL